MKYLQKHSKLLAGASVAAVMALSSAPATAAPVTQAAPAPILYNTSLDELNWSSADETAERHRRYRRYNPYRRHHRHRRHRSTAGDIITGVLILGGIAAIADAASKNKRRDRDRDRDYRNNRDARYPDQRSGQGNELNTAADQCAYAAEERAGRDARVQRIDKVERDGNGWRVEGTVSARSGTEAFQCGVTSGNIDYVQIGDGSAAAEY